MVNRLRFDISIFQDYTPHIMNTGERSYIVNGEDRSKQIEAQDNERGVHRPIVINEEKLRKQAASDGLGKQETDELIERLKHQGQ